MGSLHAEAALTAQTSGPGEGAPPRRVTGLVQPQPSSFRHNLFLIFSYKKLSVKIPLLFLIPRLEKGRQRDLSRPPDILSQSELVGGPCMGQALSELRSTSSMIGLGFVLSPLCLPLRFSGETPSLAGSGSFPGYRGEAGVEVSC